MNTQISVIVPYRNAAPWIARCADSLRQQDGDLEFIFVDDHSTDGSNEALEAARKEDGRFRFLENEFAPGVSGARNTGLQYAAGDWVAFLDADDEWLPGTYEVYKDIIETPAEIHQENTLRHYVDKGLTLRKYENAPGMYDLNNLPELWVSACNKLYRRDLVEDIRFIEGMQYGEDELFNLECLAKARWIHHGGEITVRHNVENPNSLSHIRTGRDLAFQIQKLAEFITDHDDPDIRRTAYDILSVHINSGWYFRGICEGEREAK